MLHAGKFLAGQWPLACIALNHFSLTTNWFHSTPAGTETADNRPSGTKKVIHLAAHLPHPCSIHAESLSWCASVSVRQLNCRFLAVEGACDIQPSAGAKRVEHTGLCWGSVEQQEGQVEGQNPGTRERQSHWIRESFCYAKRDEMNLVEEDEFAGGIFIPYSLDCIVAWKSCTSPWMAWPQLPFTNSFFLVACVHQFHDKKEAALAYDAVRKA
jgi:hypothetical protein